MKRLLLTGDVDCDDILHWLDAHSVSVSQGLPASLLTKRWEQARRSQNSLSAALSKLLLDDWAVVTPNTDPPHLRFTVEGFRRMIEAPEVPDEIAVVADAPASTPSPAPATVATATEAVMASPPPPTAAAAPPRGPSEADLRNGILGVYRDLKLRAGARLIGMTLSRYWQEMGNRAGDLRSGIDLLVRDGFLQPTMVGIDRHWTLTDEGADFIYAPKTSALLSEQAPAFDEVSLEVPIAGELRLLTVRIIAAELEATGTRIDYSQLRPIWMQRTRLDDSALLHGLDMLDKRGYVRLHSAQPFDVELTTSGRAAVDHTPAKISRLFSALNRALGG